MRGRTHYRRPHTDNLMSLRICLPTSERSNAISMVICYVHVLVVYPAHGVVALPSHDGGVWTRDRAVRACVRNHGIAHVTRQF